MPIGMTMQREEVTTREIFLTIPGTPIAQKRPRFARRGKFVTTYSDQETEAGRFIALAAAELKRHSFLPTEAPVRLDMTFIFPWPASVSLKKRRADFRHYKKPDVDNCIKFVMDCLLALLYHDDKQVWYVSAAKEYGAVPGTEIMVTIG